MTNNYILCILGNNVEITKERVARLQECYIDLTLHASKDMCGHIPVDKLQFSVLCLPPNLTDYKMFVKNIKADIEEAEVLKDIFYVIGDYFNYSILKHVINIYGSEKLKKEMAEYMQRMEDFRRETRLEVFSQVCEDKAKKIDNRLSTMVTKHQKDWATIKLEEVEEFRMETSCEMSLYNFCLQCVAIAHGCVEITWQVPSFLVAYIQKSVKTSSPTLMKHHVTTLTIDGFIAYDSTTGILCS